MVIPLLSRLRPALPPDNAPRFPGVQGHVESWFWRANHPTERKAVWIKATVLVPLEGEPTADVWCITFDGDDVAGRRSTVPLPSGRFDGDPLVIELAGARFELDPHRGRLTGTVEDLSWDLSFRPTSGPLAEPLCLLPTRRLLAGPLPRSKAITPFPSLVFDGSIRRGKQEWAVRGWDGMQGHNWGREHAEEYAWAQCLFPGSEGPAVVVEGVSVRLRMGGRLTPWLSGLVVRRGSQAWRFDRIVDTWRQDVAINDMTWTLRIRGSQGAAVLTVQADRAEMACLGYRNPDGRLSYCMNSKLSAVTLRVDPVNDDAFDCRSEHGGALEFLRAEPDSRLGEVV